MSVGRSTCRRRNTCARTGSGTVVGVWLEKRAALLQGIVWCGDCGRKMGGQHHATKEKRSATYICQQGHQQDREDTICQSMTTPPRDAGAVQGFLTGAPLECGAAW